MKEPCQSEGCPGSFKVHTDGGYRCWKCGWTPVQPDAPRTLSVSYHEDCEVHRYENGTLVFNYDAVKR